MTPAKALAEIEEALRQRGFLPCAGEFPTFEGSLPLYNHVVRVTLSFPCLRFTRLPFARLTHRAEDMPEAVAHIEEDDRLCYAAPGSIVLDMHAPGENALTVLELVEKALGDVASGAAQLDVAAEFPQHWLPVLTTRLALPPAAAECPTRNRSRNNNGLRRSNSVIRRAERKNSLSLNGLVYTIFSQAIEN